MSPGTFCKFAEGSTAQPRGSCFRQRDKQKSRRSFFQPSFAQPFARRGFRGVTNSVNWRQGCLPPMMAEPAKLSPAMKDESPMRGSSA